MSITLPQVYVVGDQVGLSVVFLNAAGVATDPTSVTLRIQDPAGTQTTPAATHVSTGNYTYTFTATSAGRYIFKWTGTGTVPEVVEGFVTVNPSIQVPQPAGLTAYDVIYAAFRIAGVLRGPQRGLSQSEIAEGIGCFNSLLDSWNADNLNIFTVGGHTFTLVVNQQSYTIGKDPSGLLTADFDAPRPARITNANIITQIGGGQPVRSSLDIVNVDGWSSIPVIATGSGIPQTLYDDYDAPFSRLYLYPFPNAAGQLELFYWTALTQVTSQADKMNLPPAYRKALEYNLALDLAPRFAQFAMHPTVMQQAAKAKYDLEAINSDIPTMSCDPALLSAKKSTWSYLTGNFNTNTRV